MVLEADFFSENRDKPKFTRKGANIIFPRQKLFFEFTSPPDKAEDVRVTVREDVEFLDGTPKVTGRVLGEMIGKIEAKTFQPETGKFRPLDNKKDSLRIELAFGDRTFGAEMEIPLPEAEDVASHQLWFTVTGKVGGKVERFDSSVRIHVHYPLAMIVPTRGARNDPSLDTVNGWSKQWLAHDKDVRKRVETSFLRLTSAPADKDYNDIVAAFGAAAEHADERAGGAGVIALATGHGDNGGGRLQPWFNLAPEDWAPPVGNTPNRYQMDIDDYVLTDGLAEPPRGPTDTEKVKLRALDRIAAVLKPHHIRRIILHTCHVGLNTDFVQMVADRLQVPVRAQREEIVYTGFSTAKDIAAHYGGENIVRPRDETQWPVRKLASPVYPGKEPKRW
jgi:hypothetical protein